jgi:hypothetical protein
MRKTLIIFAAVALLSFAVANAAMASPDLHVRLTSLPTAIPNTNPYCIFGQFASPATVNDGAGDARVEECLAWTQFEDNGGTTNFSNFTFALPGGLIFVTYATYSVWPTDRGFYAVTGSGQITGGTGTYADAHGTASVGGRFTLNSANNSYRVVWTLHLD